MKNIFILTLIAVLCSCAAGPVYVAKNESESMKTIYSDTKLNELYQKNGGVLKGIYERLNKANVNIYKEGIGLITLTDTNKEKLHFITMNIRPTEIYFNELNTKPEQRFGYVLSNHFTKYLHFVHKEDLDRDDIEGLAMGIYWPVRDFSQCDTYGGFIEYIHIYFIREDVWDYLDGRKTFAELVDGSEVVASLNLQPAKSIKPIF